MAKKMSRHMMLTQSQVQTEDMELPGMTEDSAKTAHGRAGAGMTVFRRGRASQPSDVKRDLEAGRRIFSQRLDIAVINPARVWESLGLASLSQEVLTGNGLFLDSTAEPAVASFDILRSRLLMGIAEKGWKRIAITSPTHGCGKSFVAANLALSLARRPGSRTVLLDLDLRRPALANLFGLQDFGAIDDFLSGEQPLESHFRRYGRTLALGLNSKPCDMAAEQLHDPDSHLALNAMMEQLDPEVVLYDLPPALVSDDVLALAPCIDAVLLVTDGTQSTPEDIRAAEQAFDGRLPLLGVVLNRAQDQRARRFLYGKG